MIVEPKIMGNICLTAHPVGCAIEVNRQIEYVKQQPKIEAAKNVLILGCSGGYGLATRIALTYACNSVTLGASFERTPTESKGGSVGYYNNRAFSNACKHEGKKELTINIDAFSDEGKSETIRAAKELFNGEPIDLVIYSLASPMRVDPVDGKSFKSVLKPIGQSYQGKTVDIFTGEIKDITVPPATEEEIIATVKVMGGEDWQRWINFLMAEQLLASGAITVAYSYIGPTITSPVYREGTIGKAKEHLEQSAAAITSSMAALQGKAYVSVNKAVVTRASSVIPVVPLYMALMFKIMKEKGSHEDCIEQEYRMLDRLYSTDGVVTDVEGRLRLDDYEMADDVQALIERLWSSIDSTTLKAHGDLEGVRQSFMRLHGFEVPGVDYSADITLM